MEATRATRPSGENIQYCVHVEVISVASLSLQPLNTPWMHIRTARALYVCVFCFGLRSVFKNERTVGTKPWTPATSIKNKTKNHISQDKLHVFGASALSFEEFKVLDANFTLNHSTSISLTSPQCCNSSVNHCGFIHPAINLSPRGAAALAMNLNVC